ncbi:MAG: hypothetical protein A2W91_13930 [Bacteroidetes bacterium GWF2_38_335]|nr:MAG: hypothetical protein A2W91_13930 [Bacteroidetes bacterium GWF2_38_335]OFY77814.1 MAG: hypothetical protein A2281_15620 [Bacteroidetes bacterium RIFOXYA12_FULL_38_20]HBS87379.1 hypothetical protein [Bacteroidales bacterium]
MEENNLNIEVLISRYLSGEANHSETEIVDKWKAESEENFLLFRDYKKIWDNSRNLKPLLSINIDNEWEKLSGKINFNEVTLANKKRSFPLMKIAAVLLFLAVTVFVANYFLNTNGTNKMNVEEGPKEVMLADGTKITLNKNSSIEYPDKFDDDIRSVQIDGEAYFEVEKDKKKPFIVKAEDLNIRVTGTSFYVNTGENNQIVVIVKEGQVEVYKDENSKIKVGPNERASFDKTRKEIIKEGIEDDNYLAWKTKKLIFKDKKLEKVIQSINKAYDCEIVLANKENSNCRFTDTFDNLSLDAILNLLKANFDFQVSKTGSKIELKGGGC